MKIDSFADELLSIQKYDRSITKIASKSRLFERFGVIGGASGLGALGLDHLKAMATENPWDAPRSTATQAATKGALGGLTAAGAIKLLGMMATRKLKR